MIRDFLAPDTLPLIRIKFFWNNLYNTKRFYCITRSPPIRPARFLPLNTRLGATDPIKPGTVVTRTVKHRSPWLSPWLDNTLEKPLLRSTRVINNISSCECFNSVISAPFQAFNVFEYSREARLSRVSFRAMSFSAGLLLNTSRLSSKPTDSVVSVYVSTVLT